MIGENSFAMDGAVTNETPAGSEARGTLTVGYVQRLGNMLGNRRHRRNRSSRSDVPIIEIAQLWNVPLAL